MDRALALIESGNVRDGVDRLVHTLATKRRTLGQTAWRAFAREALAHRITPYLHADPFTFRAFSKPRGYAGDAVMMDYIYGVRREELPQPAADVFDYTTRWGASPRSVRARRVVLARAIDHVAEDLGRPIDVVAFAAGHLREVELSASVAQGQARITAVDADPESIEEAVRSYSSVGVVGRHGSVRQVLCGKLGLPAADLVYTAGLYDYLTDPVAERLTCALFNAVRPGGTMLIANFLPDIADAGYMESFMDWHLIYRNDQQMRELVGVLTPSSIAAVRQFHDAHDHITFLEVTRR
jgi:hypothetical protein